MPFRVAARTLLHLGAELLGQVGEDAAVEEIAAALAAFAEEGA